MAQKYLGLSLGLPIEKADAATNLTSLQRHCQLI